jgi:hypothetical protein
MLRCRCLSVAMISAIGVVCLSAAGANATDVSATDPPIVLKQIIVVFKSHFDIGYTAMAKDVVNETSSEADYCRLQVSFRYWLHGHGEGRGERVSDEHDRPDVGGD